MFFPFVGKVDAVDILKYTSPAYYLDDYGTRWLYADDWSKEKLQTFEVLHAIPVISQWLDYKLDLRADEEYLRRYQMDYSDIHDPRKLKQTGSGTRLVQSSYQWIGRNIGKLYK